MKEELKKNEITKTENEVQTAPEEKKEDKKPGLLKRAWRGVKAGMRKVRESPAATLIGVGIGAVGAGAGMAIASLISARAARKEEDEPVEEEIVQEFDEPDEMEETNETEETEE